MGDRAAVQAIKAKLSPKVFLWRKFKCHQNTNLGHPDSKSPSHGHTKAHQTPMEFLGIGYNDKNNAHVLRKLLHFS